MPFSKNRIGHTFFMMMFFACLGITTEVVFTALSAFITGQTINGKPLYALSGYSYLWMIPVYALIPLTGLFIHPKVNHWPVFWRLPFFVLLVYIVEFSSGLLLKIGTGSCPWEYTSGWHIMGLIRLDYFPAWLLFVWIVEYLYVFINNRVIR